MGIQDDLDLATIADERVRTGFVLLPNRVEDIKRENAELRAENDGLRDEIQRLKGEQGKPKIKGNTLPPSAPRDYSSEQERRAPMAWTKSEKTTRIVIDREQTLEVAQETLPAGAVFNGNEDAVVQDVVFHTDNALFHKEKYYSAAEGKTYLAPLPPSYVEVSRPSR